MAAINEERPAVVKMQKKSKKKPLPRGFLIFFLILFCVTLFFLSPFLDIKNIELYGNVQVSEDAVFEASGLNKINNLSRGQKLFMNFFSLSSEKIEKNIKTLPYIKAVEVVKKFPDTIIITVTERVVRGYVDYKGMTYILIDEEGTVLGTQTYMDSVLPLIIGLDVEGFAIGGVLAADNSDSFQAAVILSKRFEKYELEVAKMDVSDIFDIHLYIDNLDVSIGSMDDIDIKLQNIKGIIEQRGESVRGFLDCTDAMRDPVFKPLK